AAILAIQLEEVVPLQHLVAELGVADALARVEPGAHRIFLEHGADAKVLADVSQEVDGAESRGPVQVVDKARGVVAVEAQKTRNLALQVSDPLGDGFGTVERSFGGRLRVADETGRAADEAERPVPGQL